MNPNLRVFDLIAVTALKVIFYLPRQGRRPGIGHPERESAR